MASHAKPAPSAIELRKINRGLWHANDDGTLMASALGFDLIGWGGKGLDRSGGGVQALRAIARVWDGWWLTALFVFFGVGLLGWIFVAAHLWVPAPWAAETELVGWILIAAKFSGVIVLVLGQAVVELGRWLRNPNWEDARTFGEICILISLLMTPPYLAERWYGINWWLALVVTMVIVLPIVWKPLRLKRPW